MFEEINNCQKKNKTYLGNFRDEPLFLLRRSPEFPGTHMGRHYER